MTDPDSTLGLILDGGLARRMGGVDKGLIWLGGKRMLGHVIERMRPQCEALALSANGDPARFADFGLAVLADDPQSFAGPLAGLLAGLELAAGYVLPRLTHVATIPADTPFLPLDFIARLHRARRDKGAEVAVASSGGRLHWVAALWPVSIAADLRRALVDDGLRKVQSFSSSFRLAFVDWPSEPIDPFFNINTPEDLTLAEKILERRAE